MYLSWSPRCGDRGQLQTRSRVAVGYAGKLCAPIKPRPIHELPAECLSISPITRCSKYLMLLICSLGRSGLDADAPRLRAKEFKAYGREQSGDHSPAPRPVK